MTSNQLMKCLFCESVDIRNSVIPGTTIFNDKEFTYHQCRNCRLVFIDPLPQTEDYQKMYANSYHESFYFKDQQADFSYLEPVFEKYKFNNTLLDYGCGDAGFLKFFQAKGLQSSGTEYDPDLVRQLSEKNPGISFSTIPDFWKNNEKGNYNFIHLGDVLEHLEEPRKFLKDIANKIDKQNGVLIVEGPLENNKSFTFFVRYLLSGINKLLRPAKKAKHIPYHITFSNAVNQQKLFEECGFETLSYKIFETAWPYPATPGRSPGTVIKFVVAKISIVLSGMLPFAKMGNRFIYTGRLRKQ